MLKRCFRRCAFRAFVALAIAGGLATSAMAGDETRSMPPATVVGTKALTTEHFFGNEAIAHRISAEPWNPAGIAQAKSAATAGGGRAKPLQIGYPRDIAAASKNLPLSSLAWQSLADGSRVLRMELRVTDAPAFRVGYRLDGPALGLQVRFAGSGRDEVYAMGTAAAAADSEVVWSPVLEGDTATIELRLMPEFSVEQFQMSLAQLSHLIVSPTDFGRKDTAHIGRSGSCNIDIACVQNPSTALLSVAKATAKMVYTEFGRSFLCTGTLLNSSSGADYFFSAAHCITTQPVADTLSTYWFFDAVACNSTAFPPYQLVNGGAILLMTDPTLDVTLLQLRQAPPIGAVRAAWNATVVSTGTNVVDVHHPRGDLKKFSQGNVLGYSKFPLDGDAGFPLARSGKDSFINVQWVDGTTEGGSSGSGLFTYNSSCNGGAACYELRGGLAGGGASCADPTAADYFSRMDLLYTRLAPYLRPADIIPTSNSTQASMVEFFNPEFDFYFISTREAEKSILDTLKDSQSNQLWYRTGYWFKTDAVSSSATSSLTRYYIPGAAKGGARGSHFYTVLNADKSAITGTGKERFASPTAGCNGVPNGFFCNEGTDSYILPPIGAGASGTCQANEQKIYRTFRANSARYNDDGNHRYLTNPSMFSYMVNDLGWANEGVAFCAKP